MVEIRVKSTRRIEARDVTEEVRVAVRGKEGKAVHLFCLHTTCGLTINENADPAVMEDLLDGLGRIVPDKYPYRHREGNSDAHIKSTLVGASLTIPLSEGHLVLGTWQGVYLLEFDGPRERKIGITII